MAETTTATLKPCFTFRRIFFATIKILSVSATELPPYFCTTMFLFVIVILILKHFV